MAYGTIARLRAKPGKQQELLELMHTYDDLDVPGMRGTNVYQMDDDADVYMISVVFDSKEAYHANANDPAQNQRYEKMAALLAEEPQWHDGEIVHTVGK